MSELEPRVRSWLQQRYDNDPKFEQAYNNWRIQIDSILAKLKNEADTLRASNNGNLPKAPLIWERKMSDSESVTVSFYDKKVPVYPEGGRDVHPWLTELKTDVELVYYINEEIITVSYYNETVVEFPDTPELGQVWHGSLDSARLDLRAQNGLFRWPLARRMVELAGWFIDRV